MENMNNETYLKYLEMVRKDGLNLMKVPSKYQTKEICIEALKQNGNAIVFIENQTPEICLEAVKQNKIALQFVKNQTPEICLAAVKRDGWTLQFVKNQTPKICMEAVKQDGYALKYVKNQTSEICLEAVKQDGWVLEFVRNQTPEICLEAVKQDGLALKYIKEQTSELCLEAVKQNGMALEYVKNQTKEICMEAIKQTGWALEFVKEQTPEMCLEAVKQDERTFIYIRDQYLKEKIENELIESKLFKETDAYRAFITDGIDCDSSYKSLKDNIERPATIVLDTECNSIIISFNDNKTKCNAKDILNSLGNYDIWGTDNSAEIDLYGLSDDKISELFTDTIMKVDESVREHYDLSKDISDKNVKDVGDIEL